MDSELQRTFNLAVENGINLFDTADSYGTGRLNGQSEKLLGKFISEFQGLFSSCCLIFGSPFMICERKYKIWSWLNLKKKKKN